MSEYRNQVLRDLRWLLNARCHPRDSSIHRYPHVAASVLNYGMRDMVGMTNADVEPDEVIEAVKTAILRFEPRIVHGSLVVTLAGNEREFKVDSFALEIHGELWALPMNEPLVLRSQWSCFTNRWQVE